MASLLSHHPARDSPKGATRGSAHSTWLYFWSMLWSTYAAAAADQPVPTAGWPAEHTGARKPPQWWGSRVSLETSSWQRLDLMAWIISTTAGSKLVGGWQRVHTELATALFLCIKIYIMWSAESEMMIYERWFKMIMMIMRWSTQSTHQAFLSRFAW